MAITGRGFPQRAAQSSPFRAAIASAAPVIVTPDTGSLVLSAFAPTVSTPVLVTPGIATLALSAFAPQVNLGVIPPTSSLALTTFAPSVAATANVSVTPDIAALTLSAFASTVTVGSAASVTPDTAALTLTGFAPTIIITVIRLVTVGADDAQQVGTTMTLTGTTIGADLDATTDWAGMRFLNINIPRGATVQSAVIEVVPSASTLDEPLVTVFVQNADDTATFTTTASDISNRPLTTGVAWSNTNLGADGATYFSAPAITADVQAVINRAGWVSGNSLSVIIQGGATGTRDLTIVAFENAANIPARLTVAYIPPLTVTPGTGSLTLTTFAPSVAVGGNVLVTPSTAVLVTAGFAPTVATPQVVTPGVLALTLSAFAPQVNLGVIPPTAALTLSTFAPVVSAPVLATPGTVALVLSAFAPSVATPQVVTPGVLALVLSTFAPSVDVSASGSVIPGTLALVLTTFAPSVTVSECIYEDTILAEAGLVSYWRLNEAAGALVDSLGTNDLTANNAPTYSATGLLAGDPADTSLDFERGSVQYLSIADNASLDLGDVVTIEAWINLESTGLAQGILSKGSGGYYLRVNTANRLEFLKSQTSIIVASTNTLSAATVYHVVATKDGATVKLYVNGMDVTGTVTNATLANTAIELNVGGDSLFATERFDGVIDEVALYSVALSATQVLDHYECGIGAAPRLVTPDPATLVLTTFAPVVNTPVLVTPSVLALALTTFAPSVATPRLVTPGVLVLTLTLFAPTVGTTGNVTIPALALVITTFAPTVNVVAVQEALISAIILALYEPSSFIPCDYEPNLPIISDYEPSQVLVGST